VLFEILTQPYICSFKTSPPYICSFKTSPPLFLAFTAFMSMLLFASIVQVLLSIGVGLQI